MSDCHNIKNKTSCLKNFNCMYRNSECKKKSMYSVFIHGGMGYGSICLPDNFLDLCLIIIYPPLYVFFQQKTQNFKNVTQIITSFILTCCFYFPGFIHALYIKYGSGQYCGSLFEETSSDTSLFGLDKAQQKMEDDGKKVKTFFKGDIKKK